jgi:hypothetical protein
LDEELRRLVRLANAFAESANATLSTHESSVARSITLEETYASLGKLSLKQDELLRQSLRCIESSLFRAAHVLSWAALMDFIEEQLGKDGFVGVNGVRSKWTIKTMDDLRDIGSDFQIIELFRELKMCTKTEEKALKGLLNKRNECAHPTDYFPDLNQSLGYVSEILNRIGTFQKRWKGE